MPTPPRSLTCEWCGAPPFMPCVKGGFYDGQNDGETRTHKARHVDAYRADLIAEAKASPEGTLLGDAYREVNRRMDNGTYRVSAFLEAVQWMEERS